VGLCHDSRTKSGVSQRSAALAAETAARQAAETALQVSIDAVSTGSTVPAVLTQLANYITIDSNTINGLPGPHIIFTGVNLHLRNGQGGTYSSPASMDSSVSGRLNRSTTT
jgi:hypothetical protein